MLQGNGGIQMWKKLSSKELTWACRQICLMHTQSMGSQDLFFHVLENVSRTFQEILLKKVLVFHMQCFQCSNLLNVFSDTFAMEVESGKTYLLRIINAALND